MALVGCCKPGPPHTRRPRGESGVGAQPGVQVASQQLLVEFVTPPIAVQRSPLDLTEQRFRTGGHVELSVHAVVPSSQKPFVHVPGEQNAQATNPVFLPHVERAAQRVTAPLQFTSSWLFRTAVFTW